jgi:hypothetical protein
MREKSNLEEWKMDIGDTVYCYRIKLDFIKNQTTKERTEHKILGINNKRLVLDDYSFTHIDLKKESYNSNSVINKPDSYYSHWGGTWDEMKTYLYTREKNSKKAFVKAKKAMEEYIYEKFGRFSNAIDMLDSLEVDE